MHYLQRFKINKELIFPHRLAYVSCRETTSLIRALQHGYSYGAWDVYNDILNNRSFSKFTNGDIGKMVSKIDLSIPRMNGAL